MAAIFQTKFSIAFSWIKMYDFGLNVTEVCSYGSDTQYSTIGSYNGWVPSRRQAIIWINDSLFTDAYMCQSVLMS